MRAAPPSELAALPKNFEILKPAPAPKKPEGPLGPPEAQIAHGLGVVIGSKEAPEMADRTLEAIDQKKPFEATLEKPQRNMEIVAGEYGRLEKQLEMSTLTDAQREALKSRLSELQNEMKGLMEAKRDKREASSGEPEKKQGSAAENLDPNEVLHKRSEGIRKLVRYITEGKGDKVDVVKDALNRWLAAREELYFTVARQLNPQIQRESEHVYRQGEKVRGSIIAMLDATPQLESHAALANKIQIAEILNSEVVMGEEVLPRPLVESMMVMSGSSGQDRIQPFGADMDMAEYVRVTASSMEKAGESLASAIKQTIHGNEHIKHADADGKTIELHFTGMKLGTYPSDAEGDLAGKSLKWSYEALEKGELTYTTQKGETKTIRLQDACQNPGFWKADYIAVSEGSVYEATKVSYLTVQNHEKQRMFPLEQSPPYGVYQEVFYGDPPTDVIMAVNNADTLVGYVNAMTEQVAHYGNPETSDYNPVKVGKRMYNLEKVLGDVSTAQELTPLFQGDEAAIYMLADRLRVAIDAKRRGIDVGTQMGIMKDRLLKLCQKRGDSLGLETSQLLNSDGPIDMGKVLANARIIINQEGTAFFASQPKLDKIRQEAVEQYRHE